MHKRMNQMYFSALLGIFVFGLIVLPVSTDLPGSEIARLLARAIFVMVVLYVLTLGLGYLTKAKKLD